MDKIGLIFLGWLLGLLSPAVVEAIRRGRENRVAANAIHAELREVAYKLALACHYIYVHQGKVDRDRLEWIKGVAERYGGAHDPMALTESFRMQLAWSDEEIEATSRAVAERQRPSIVLQRYAVPLLDGRVNALWSFDSSFTRSLLEIRSGIGMLDDLVERSRHYADLTFGKLENGNYELVIGNLRQCYSEYAERAELVVSQIEHLKFQL
jgi:hypothetical protein